MASTAKNIFDLNYFLMFATKYRQPIFTQDHQKEIIQQALLNTAKNKKINIHNLIIDPNNVKLYLDFPPQESISNITKSLKGTSSRLFFKEFPELKEQLVGGNLWASNYLVATYGGIPRAVADKYVFDQLTPHMQKQLKNKGFNLK